MIAKLFLTICSQGEALRQGVVDCETFLKHVRKLSRRQFVLRATMNKCRQTAGLPA
jgi:ESCRT-I complex subunit TSG101